MNSDQIAELFNGTEVDLTDDQGNTVTFKITAQDNILNFKATTAAAFDFLLNVLGTIDSQTCADSHLACNIGPRVNSGSSDLETRMPLVLKPPTRCMLMPMLKLVVRQVLPSLALLLLLT